MKGAARQADGGGALTCATCCYFEKKSGSRSCLRRCMNYAVKGGPGKAGGYKMVKARTEACGLYMSYVENSSCFNWL